MTDICSTAGNNLFVWCCVVANQVHLIKVASESRILSYTVQSLSSDSTSCFMTMHTAALLSPERLLNQIVPAAEGLYDEKLSLPTNCGIEQDQLFPKTGWYFSAFEDALRCYRLHNVQHHAPSLTSQYDFPLSQQAKVTNFASDGYYEKYIKPVLGFANEHLYVSPFEVQSRERPIDSG